MGGDCGECQQRQRSPTRRGGRLRIRKDERRLGARCESIREGRLFGRRCGGLGYGGAGGGRRGRGRVGGRGVWILDASECGAARQLGGADGALAAALGAFGVGSAAVQGALAKRRAILDGSSRAGGGEGLDTFLRCPRGADQVPAARVRPAVRYGSAFLGAVIQGGALERGCSGHRLDAPDAGSAGADETIAASQGSGEIDRAARLRLFPKRSASENRIGGAGGGEGRHAGGAPPAGASADKTFAADSGTGRVRRTALLRALVDVGAEYLGRRGGNEAGKEGDIQ